MAKVTNYFLTDGLQELMMLNLNDNRLTSLPQEVGRLKKLTRLSLNHNQLTTIPEELFSLRHLSELHLNYNQLMCIPEEIKLLRNLQQLSVVRNNLEGLPEGLCHLRKLRILDIAGNVIQTFPDGEIATRCILQLEEDHPLILEAMEYYPEIKDIFSQAKQCAICRKSFFSEWVECVQFVSLPKLLDEAIQETVIREMQIKMTLKFHLIRVRMAKIKNSSDSTCWRVADAVAKASDVFLETQRMDHGGRTTQSKTFHRRNQDICMKTETSSKLTPTGGNLKNDRSKEEEEKRAVGQDAYPHCEDIKQWCKRRLPILEWAPQYNLRENLLPDTVSGVMLAVQQVTQGLSFAILSSVHPVFGLYGSLFPAIIYAVFGMGRHVATGTFALTSLISANAVERLVPQSSRNLTTESNSSVLGLSDFELQRIGVAAAVSFLGGVIQMVMFVLQLGSATFLLTEPVISAMTTGAATHVVTSQVKYLLGIKMPYISGPLGFFYIYAYVFENIKSVRLEALLLSLLSIVVLVLVKELNEQFKRKIKVVLPVDLVLIIAASFACYCTNMESTYGLEVVGHIPNGIPPPRAPPMNVLSAVLTEAFGVALVGYVASLALAQGSAKKFKYSVDDNQEFLAHGLSNVIPSFFFCIPSAAAMGRTAGLYSTGAKTQVACLISCIFVLIVIYAIGPLLYWLPMCVLASIIVVGLKGMLIQFRDLKKYWNVDKIDWGIWISTYIFTICFAANVGLLFGVVCTIAIVLGRFPRARTLSVTNMKEMEFKVKTEMHDETLQQIKIISVNNPLVFLNAKKFNADLMKIVLKENDSSQPLDDVSKCEQNTLLNSLSNGNCNEEASQPCPGERCSLVLDCNGLTFFDYTGVSTLVELYLDCKSRSVDVYLANCTASLIKAMAYCGDLDTEKPIFFDSVPAAISAVQSNKNLSKVSDHSEV